MTLRIPVGSLFAVLVCTSTAEASGGTSSSAQPSELGQPEDLVMMVVYATVALGFSFLCSVAEAVVLSMSPSYIANLERQGKKSARLLKKDSEKSWAR